MTFSLVVADADLVRAGGMTLAANRWDVNTETGVVSYDLTLTATGAAAGGQPCASYCTWKMEAWYRDGAVETLRRNLASGPAHKTNDFTLTRTMAPTRLPEITHVRAVLTPDYAGSSTTWTTSWVSVSPPYPDGGVGVTVTRWDADVDTGSIAYDLMMRWWGAGQYEGPCTGYCSWDLRAFYRDGTVEMVRGAPLSSGSVYSNGVWEQTFRVAGSMKAEVTHLQARLFPYNSPDSPLAYSRWIEVHPRYPTGSPDSVVRDWAVDPGTGVTSYDVGVTWKGAAQVNGPCAGYCRWALTPYYRDGTVERQQGSPLSTGTIYAANTWTVPSDARGSLTADVTHLKATLEPYDATSTAERYVRWIPVGVGAREKSVALNVSRWSVDGASGKTDYDVTLTFAGAGNVGGPCENVQCTYEVEGWYADDSTELEKLTLHSGECPTGCWSVTKRISAAGVSLQGVTHLRARVSPAACSEPCSREGFDTGLVFVGDNTVEGQDVVPFEAALASALAADPLGFCSRLAVEGSGLPNTNGTSPSDAWEACEAAIQLHGPAIRKVLAAIAAAAGGVTALDMLLDEHVNDGTIPSAEEEQNPPAPWIPPNDWQDNGCYWQSIQYTPASEAHLITHGHLYAHRMPRKSYFYPWVKVKPLAEKYSLTVMPVPDPSNANNCRRWVTYPTYVGVDALKGVTTATYRLVTDRLNGNVVTMFPDEP